ADRHVLEVHRRAGVGVGPTGIGRPCATGIVSVSDPDEEVRTAIRLVTAWMGEGVPLAGVALLYAVADPYARLLHEQLAAAGLVHNGAPVRAAGEMVFGRTLLRLLGLGDRSFRRSDVLAVVTGTPPADGGGRAPSRAWERISRAASVVDGPDWDRRLATFADTARRRATEAERVEQESLAGHLRRDGERATQLACFVRGLRGELETLASADSWTALVEGTHRLMDRHLGDESHRRSWPDEEQKAADRVEQALDSLAGLDSIGGPAPNLDTFRHTLEGELETALPRFGRFGDGVLVGHVSMAVGLELERVIVLGMAEGAFPARRREDSLLPDDERRAAGGELRLRRDLVHDDLRQLLAAVAAAREATLCFPRGDLRRQGDRAASRWLLVDAARLAGRPALFTADLANPATRSGDWFIHVPSHASGLVRGVLPATAQDLRLATMLRDPVKVIANDPGLALGMELARARRSESFTRFDGNLAGLDLPDYAASGVVSATRLESWAVCPYAFLMRYLLKVEVADDPERTLEMNPLDKGSLVHEVLDRFVTEAVTSGRNPPWTDQDNSHLAEIADEVCRKFHDRGATGRAMFWRRDRVRIRADLQRFAGMDDRHPLYSERRFEDLAYPLPDGRSVKFRGTIDRIDRSPDGSAAVTDYKTGGTRGYQGLSAEDPHQGGRHLQLAVYAAAAREPGGSDVEAEYWFVTTKGNFRRIGYRVTDAVRHEVGNALSTIVDGIRSGVFPARPTADPSYVHVDCWYCSPDGLNSAERRRDWERKRSHPSLKRYRALCEPEVAR
ncbi:MAG: PD-(D/E)XK nuclease family protein, partial [Acidimicrobiales bacterium]